VSTPRALNVARGASLAVPDRREVRSSDSLPRRPPRARSFACGRAAPALAGPFAGPTSAPVEAPEGAAVGSEINLGVVMDINVVL